MALPAIATHDEDEQRIEYALAAMLGLESMLELMPMDTQVCARDMLGLVHAVHQQVRDVLLWAPQACSNDNR